MLLNTRTDLSDCYSDSDMPRSGDRDRLLFREEPIQPDGFVQHGNLQRARGLLIFLGSLVMQVAIVEDRRQRGDKRGALDHGSHSQIPNPFPGATAFGGRFER